MDPRITRTKQSLKEALIELIEEIGFERITVRDLTLKAGINRGTFYLHYRDKYDLLEQSKKDLLDGLLEIISGAPPQRADELYAAYVTTEPPSFLIRLFEYYEGNAEFLKIILGPKGDPSFPLELKKLMVSQFYSALERLDIDEAELPVPQRFITSVMLSAHLGLLQEWLNEDPRLPPREISLISIRLAFLGMNFSSKRKPCNP